MQLPEKEGTCWQAIAIVAASTMKSDHKLETGQVKKISDISGKPHPHLKCTSILNYSAHMDDTKLPISVLMKRAEESCSIELQVYSTLFKDMQPDSVRNLQTHGNLYNLIPRPYLIQKPFLFLENVEHEFGTVQNVWKQSQNFLDLDFRHCLMAVETLARFHATSYLFRKQLGDKGKGKLEMLQKYPFLNQQSSLQQYSRQKSSQLTPIYEQSFDLAARVIQQENPSLAFKLQRKVKNPQGIFEKVVKLLEEEKYDNDDFYVVCHGNFFPQNLLFSYDKSSARPEDPTSCRIINFDSVFFGPLASDLAMFLLTCTTLEFRLEFEEKLLAFYCDAFQEQLMARSGRSTSNPIVEEFEENIDEFHRKVEKQYKKMMEFAFYNACVLIPLMLFNNNNNDINSIKDLLDEDKCAKFFQKEKTFEQFALENAVWRERLEEILKQLAKCRVLL